MLTTTPRVMCEFVSGDVLELLLEVQQAALLITGVPSLGAAAVWGPGEARRPGVQVKPGSLGSIEAKRPGVQVKPGGLGSR